jgi:hypothetical protein
MPDSLVAIDERMVEHQRKAKGCCFAGDIGIEILSAETLAGLCRCNLKREQFVDA